MNYIRNKHYILADKIILPITSIQAKLILEYLVETQFTFIEEDENVFLILEKNAEFVKKNVPIISEI
ncbi:MAG: hypothetical protein O9267_12425 [Flavobacterium sp.]|uniref:hypothetical protein n=1 Tax=Flavobacterium sp. TaxID=239 RepID=UPI0022CA274D|nr:hypothetical protein [Flavobacterium sp.]MCZ8198402.1 hypothetical protein [Flavobacterium sp.]